MNKLQLQSVRAKIKDRTRHYQYLQGPLEFTAKVTLRFSATGKPGFAEAELSEKIAERLKDFEI